jgi:nucleoside-diphosphate-sugar epimerase
MNKNILLTGGNGYIGQALINQLLDNNYNVISLIRTKNINSNNAYKEICYDGSFESISRNLIDEKIDIVVHLATLFLTNHNPSQINELITSNITLGTHLLELCKERSINYFINTSTYAISVNGIDYDPQNLYAATKKSFLDIQKFYELICINTNFINLELFDTYGIGDNRPKFINLLIDSIKNNRDFNMSAGNQEISYQYIEDVCNAYITLIDNINNSTQKFKLLNFQ